MAYGNKKGTLPVPFSLTGQTMVRSAYRVNKSISGLYYNLRYSGGIHVLLEKRYDSIIYFFHPDSVTGFVGGTNVQTGDQYVCRNGRGRAR